MEFLAAARCCRGGSTWLCKLSWTDAEVNLCFAECQGKYCQH